jgi:ankyrin repeat protein
MMSDTPFYRLSTKIYLEIGSNLKAPDLAALIRTCHRCYDSMQDMLYNATLTYTLNPGIPYEEQTVLQWAVRESKQRKCTLAALVRKGADIYVKGAFGTLLHDVAAWGDEGATKLLIRSGIHLWTIAYDVPPLVYAAGGGYKKIARYLLYDAMNTWQEYAPQRTTTCEKWNQLTKPWEEAKRPWTLQEALRRAAEGGHLEVVELLCQYVDISKPMNGIPFTTSASRGGSTEIMQILLELGAELDPSALHNAAAHGHLALVLDILSRRSVDVCDQDSDGRTSLHHVARKGHADIVQTLLHHGAEHEVVDNSDYTALEVAVLHRHDDVIKILAGIPKSAPPVTYDDPYDSAYETD